MIAPTAVWPYGGAVEIDSRTPAMMRPNPPKIAHSPLVSHSSPSFLALTNAVTTTPATMLANPRRVNKDEIARPASFLAFWCLCGSLAHRSHERR